MTHVFNPGDLAYSLIKNKWVQLSKNNNPSIFNLSLRDEDSDNLYMDDGKVRLYDHPILLPLNPYDPTDPNNPPEFRYPFMLNGRPVRIGDELVLKALGNPIYQIKSLKLVSSTPSFSVYESGADCYFPSDEFCWPDELPKKKKVAKWAYPFLGMPGAITVGFTEEMTEEEAIKSYGSSVQMIPGTEREVD